MQATSETILSIYREPAEVEKDQALIFSPKDARYLRQSFLENDSHWEALWKKHVHPEVTKAATKGSSEVQVSLYCLDDEVLKQLIDYGKGQGWRIKSYDGLRKHIITVYWSTPWDRFKAIGGIGACQIILSLVMIGGLIYCLTL